MAAHGCHLVECFWYVLLVIIESFFLAVRDSGVARTLLYKVSIAIVSRSVYEKTIASASILLSSPQLPVIQLMERATGIEPATSSLGNQNFRSFIFTTYKTTQYKSTCMRCIPRMQCLICVSPGAFAGRFLPRMPQQIGIESTNPLMM
jgi:hypothetical protein